MRAVLVLSLLGAAGCGRPPVHRHPVSPNVAPPVGQYSHAAVVHAPMALVWTAGQVPTDLDGTVPSEADAQCRLVLENVGHVLEASGMGWEDVVHLRVYLTEADLLPAFASARRAVLGPDAAPPATVVVVQSLLRPEWKIEIEAQAARTLR